MAKNSLNDPSTTTVSTKGKAYSMKKTIEESTTIFNNKFKLFKVSARISEGLNTVKKQF